MFSIRSSVNPVISNVYMQMSISVNLKHKIFLRVKNAVKSPVKYYNTQLVEEKVVRNSKGHYVKTNMYSPKFEEFYQAQNVCPSEDFSSMMDSFRTSLPSVFRLNSLKPEFSLLRNKLKKGHLDEAGAVSVPWYGEDKVWKLEKSRWDLIDEKNSKQMHHFILNQSKLGNLYRQEQVSMVPVKCLDIQSHHIILDMCASPGSKTGQVLEALHSAEIGKMPTGCVIANEPDVMRCSNLCGNMKTFQSSCLMIINHTGQTIPNICRIDGSPVEYDHIVCDVPCSGDGTIRKNPNIWSDWHPGRGNGRFPLQLNIARRGLELLKVGGTMVYSSCSINQIENEAVIAALLNESDGNLELVDVNGKFPGLNWLPGLSYWKVFDSKMNEYSKYEDVPGNMRQQIFKEMFPPDRSTALSMNLDRCMRFLPHLNDDGGFFVATLRKKGHFNVVERRKQRWNRKENSKRIKKFNASKLDRLNKVVEGGISFHHYSEVVNDVDRSLSFHGLDYLRKDCMYQVKNSGSVVRLVSPSLKDILHKGNNRLKISSAPGVSFLVKNKMACSGVSPYVLKSSCFHLLPTSSTNRIIRGDIEDVKLLISMTSVEIENLSRECQRMLWSSEIGWIKFQFSIQSFKLECLGYNNHKKYFLLLNETSRYHYRLLLDM